MTSKNRNSEFDSELSALVDGELNRAEAKFAAKRLCDQSEARATWMRMHIMRDVISGGRVQSQAFTLNARVMEAIGDEQAPKKPMSTGWMKPVAGLAVAASVAWMALIALPDRSALQPSNTLESNSVVQQPDVATSSQIFTPTLRTQAASQDSGTAYPVQNNRLRDYLSRHTQMAPTPSSNGLTKYVVLVAPAQSETEQKPGSEQQQINKAP